MATSDKQRELDEIKWNKSAMLGFDACGSFDYCKCCDKALENPCEMAHNKFYNTNIDNSHEMVVEIAGNIIEEVKEKAPKKAPAKKTTTKKSTTKSKTTTKASTKGTTKKTSTKKK